MTRKKSGVRERRAAFYFYKISRKYNNWAHGYLSEVHSLEVRAWSAQRSTLRLRQALQIKLDCNGLKIKTFSPAVNRDYTSSDYNGPNGPIIKSNSLGLTPWPGLEPASSPPPRKILTSSNKLCQNLFKSEDGCCSDVISGSRNSAIAVNRSNILQISRKSSHRVSSHLTSFFFRCKIQIKIKAQSSVLILKAFCDSTWVNFDFCSHDLWRHYRSQMLLF